jgi:hypothetical protein
MMPKKPASDSDPVPVFGNDHAQAKNPRRALIFVARSGGIC